jgi:hypothetical protein
MGWGCRAAAGPPARVLKAFVGVASSRPDCPGIWRRLLIVSRRACVEQHPFAVSRLEAGNRRVGDRMLQVAASLRRRGAEGEDIGLGVALDVLDPDRAEKPQRRL